ncbi:Mediator of RNA polymerase II transcription subunit 4 [Aphelenchoides fujianensis]|nr:Mediator of RNA polymerase II transcription subunit 4 [Aphelenchoides fujianensis]
MSAPSTSGAAANADEDPAPDEAIYTLDGRSLREKLLEIVDRIDDNVKVAVESLFTPVGGAERAQRTDDFNESIERMIGDMKRFNEMLEFVQPHQEREEYIRQLHELVDDRDQLICKLAKELKTIELSLTEATFQAHRKLKALRTAQEKRVNSEQVVRYAHTISRSYSVAAPFTWVQGDPSRPFPIELDFANSQLLNKGHAVGVAPSAMEMIRGAGSALSTAPTPRGPASAAGTPSVGMGQVRASPLTQFQHNQQQQQQRNWSPNPRSGVYGGGFQQQQQAQGSPAPTRGGGRGRPRGSSNASPRNAGPSILQRRTSGQQAAASPRLTSPMARLQTQQPTPPAQQPAGVRPAMPPALPPLQIRPPGPRGGGMVGAPPADQPQISSSSSSSGSEDD